MTQEISPIATAAKASAAVEQNTLKRRGLGLRACDPERACPGYTLFAPCFPQNRTVFLIDLQGSIVHTWTMPYAPGLAGYLTERGSLIYNGRTLENGFLSRFPFKGGAILEADWNGKILWEVRHPDHHHDGIRLRNGNVLLNCLGQVPRDIAGRVVGGAEDHNLSSGLYGHNATAYVDAFMRLIDWPVVTERLTQATAGQHRHGPQAPDDALPSISVEELGALMVTDRRPQVVDARPRNYVSRNPDTMPRAVWRDPERVDDWCGQLSPEAPVFVYCAYGFEVGCNVATVLRQRGFDARYVRGGLAAWYCAEGPRTGRAAG
jgi:rhodanese-related sulfurtransferase